MSKLNSSTQKAALLRGKSQDAIISNEVSGSNREILSLNRLTADMNVFKLRTDLRKGELGILVSVSLFMFYHQICAPLSVEWITFSSFIRLSFSEQAKVGGCGCGKIQAFQTPSSFTTCFRKPEVRISLTYTPSISKEHRFIFHSSPHSFLPVDVESGMFLLISLSPMIRYRTLISSIVISKVLMDILAHGRFHGLEQTPTFSNTLLVPHSYKYVTSRHIHT